MANVALLKGGVVQNVIVSTVAFASTLAGYDAVVDVTGKVCGPGYTTADNITFTAPVAAVAHAPASAIAVGPSLFAYQNTLQVSAVVAIGGGVVTGIAFSRDGATWSNTGMLSGSVTLLPGDWVKVGTDEGVVREIRWRQTQIATSSGDVVVVPNSALMKGVVTALGRREGGRRRRYQVTFSVPYLWGPGQVIAAVEKALRDDPPANVAADPAPSCVVTDFLDGRAAYTLRLWVTDLNADVLACSAARLRIFYGLAREGIALASEPTQAISFEDGKAVRERREADETKRRVAALRGVDLFRGLNDEEFATLAERLKTAPFAPGETLTRQGATGHWLYIIAKGEAEVQLRAEGGAERLAHLKAGDFMGEMALLTGEPRTATVLALDNVICYRLDRDSFRDIVARRPEIAESISKILVERREGLESARGTLDTRRQENLRDAQGDMLTRIRRFFALS